jgi:uncharacterized delta-60 repeat protein
MFIFRSLVSTLLLLSVLPVEANDADIDQQFGSGGVVVTDIPDTTFNFYRCGPGLQTGFKVLVCGPKASGGTNIDFAIERFSSITGAADTTFGIGGVSYIDFDGGAGEDFPTAMAVQSDDKIVIVGATSNSHTSILGNLAIGRLNSDGAPDLSFGTNGKVVVAFGNGGGSSTANDVAIQSDGKIVVVGTVSTTSRGSDFGVVRLLADGSIDQAFGTMGKTTIGFDLPLSTNFNDRAASVSLDSAGRILISGRANKGPGAANDDYAIARLTSGGQLDTTFAGGGKTTFAFDVSGSLQDASLGMTLQSDGKIVLIGTVDASVGGSRHAYAGVVRFLSSGLPDASFGSSGSVLLDFGVQNGLAYGADVIEVNGNRLTVIGAVEGAVAGSPIGAFYAGAARLGELDGALDPTFGIAGQQTYDFGLNPIGFQLFYGVAHDHLGLLISGTILINESPSEAYRVLTRIGCTTLCPAH